MNYEEFTSEKERINFVTKKMKEYNYVQSLSHYIDKNYLLNLKNIIVNSKKYKEVIKSPNFLHYIDSPYDMDTIVMIHITMIHLFDISSTLDASESKKLSYNSAYIDKLCNRVVKQVKEAALLSVFQVVAFFAYTPIMYEILNCTNMMNYFLIKKVWDTPESSKHKKNYEFKKYLITECVKTCESICALVNQLQYANAYSALRRLIEQVTIYITIKDSVAGAKCFMSLPEEEKNCHNDVKYEQNYIRKHHLDKTQKNKKVIGISIKNGQSPNDAILTIPAGYFDYGFINSIHNGPHKDFDFCFKKVSEYPNSKHADLFKARWYNAYKNCCDFVHVRFKEYDSSRLHFLTLMQATGELTLFVYNEFIKTFTINKKGEIYDTGLNRIIYKQLDDVVKETSKHRKKLNCLEKEEAFDFYDYKK